MLGAPFMLWTTRDLCGVWICVSVVACGPAGPGERGAPPPGVTVDPPAPQLSSTPIVATIDTGRTMSVVAGSGYEIYIEYESSHGSDNLGHWNLEWTCDGRPGGCGHDVKVSVSDGEITNSDYRFKIDSDHSSGQGIEQPEGTRFHAYVLTSSDAVDGVRFDTKPGATITLAALFDDKPDPARFVFVENGLVSGGYKGPLSDPIRLEPSSP